MKRLLLLTGLLTVLAVLGAPAATAAWDGHAAGTGAVRAGSLTAGYAPAVGTAGSTVHLFWEPSTVSGSVAVTDYVVRRYDASGQVQQSITLGSCASVVSATSCVETSVPDGVWTYSVTPILNNWQGAESPKTEVSVAAVPSTAVTFPAAGASHNEAAYAQGCATPDVPDVCGTVTDDGSGITRVQVSLQRRSSGLYWNGTGFTSLTEVLHDATGTTTWSLPLAVTNFPADGSYLLRVRATSGSGAVGLASSTFTMDVRPPQPTLTGTPPTLSNAPAATFTFTDAEAAVTFECRVDATSYQACASPRTYTGLGEGSHTFDVRAVDAAENRSTPASHAWTVDTIAPAASVNFPATNASYNDAGYTPGCGTDAVGDICGTASDTGSGLENVQISIRRGTGNYWDGTGFNSATEMLLTPTGTASWSYALPATSFPAEGSYTVRVRATDNAGNVHTTTSSHTIDRTAPPIPTIVGKPSNPSNTKNPAFTFANAESGVTYECRIDGGTFTACPNPYTYSGLADGSHTVEVRSMDAAGNRSNTTSSTWTIDTVAPTASITYPTAGTFYNNSTWLGGCGTVSTGDFCGTAGDAHTGVATVRVGIRRGTGNYWDGTGFNSPTEVLFAPVGTTSWSYAFLAGNFPADGAYTVRAHVTDTAGNATVGSTTFQIDRTAPTAQDIQTTNTGTNGRPEANDTITFTYSETMAPGTILTGWDGRSTNVVVRITDGGGANDVLTVWNTTNDQRLALGSVDLGRTDYVTKNVTYGLSGTASSMIQNAAAITVTLGTPSDTTALQTATGTGQMTWSTTGTGTDLAGNSGGSTATESGTPDKDF